MRHAARQRSYEEEEESVFVSMTDMTVSFLFIVMILLAFFATQIGPGETVPKALLDERDAQIAQLLEELSAHRQNDPDYFAKFQTTNGELNAKVIELEAELREIRLNLEIEPDVVINAKIRELRAELTKLHELLKDSGRENKIERYNTLVSLQRAQILQELRSRIVAADPSIEVGISRDHDALQFKGDGLFASGSYTPSRQGREKMKLISGILQDVIGCISFGDASTLGGLCNENLAILDALQIEGHADSVGQDIFNMDLSAKRGASIYREMISQNPDLLRYLNFKGQPVLSVAGYGEGRPIADDALPGGKDANRRIDIRFIMFSPAAEETVPTSINDLPRIRDLLLEGNL